MPLKEFIKSIPVLGNLAQGLYRRLPGQAPPPREPFGGSADYWERRYAKGGNSGVGSYDKFGEFKAEILNGFVKDHQVKSVAEFGCGDGNQLTLARYPAYTGYDVSTTAVAMCRERFAGDPSKAFRAAGEFSGEKSDLALSLDVIYHLVEQSVFEAYMRTLFAASSRYVIIYSSNTDNNNGYKGTHVWHRKFTPWVADNLPQWKLIHHIPNRYPYRGDYTQGSFAEFFVYEASPAA
jgi:hypothetical protein